MSVSVTVSMSVSLSVSGSVSGSGSVSVSLCVCVCLRVSRTLPRSSISVTMMTGVAMISRRTYLTPLCRSVS